MMTIANCKLQIANCKLNFMTSNFQLAIYILQFAMLFAVAGFPIPAVVAQDAVPGWHTNLDDACRAAEANGKPLFIVFRCVR
jgi:hypothetical protein